MVNFNSIGLFLLVIDVKRDSNSAAAMVKLTEEKDGGEVAWK
jgi:hypothetical protein